MKYFLLLVIVWVRCLVWNFYYEESLVSVLEVDDGGRYFVEGEVCLEPDVRREDVRYVVCVDTLNKEAGKWGRVLWKSNREVLNMGDKVNIECVLEIPFEEDGFSYKNYLRIFRVVALCDGNLLEMREFDGRFGIKLMGRKLIELKWFLLKFFDERLEEPFSSLVNGILVGSRRGFADDVMDDFARTGLTHIIAVSGYNIALVVVCVDWLFQWVPRRIRFWLHLVFLMAFTFITGMSASVVRAMIMGGLGLWAMHLGVVKQFLRILLVTVLLMFMWNPAFIFFDVGFHLSVLATCGVVFGGWVMKFFEKEESHDFLGFKEAFVMTVFAQIFTVPLIVLKFDYLSLVSPIANVLVAPILPLMMIVSVVMFGLGWLFPWLEFGCVIILDVYGRLFFWLVEVCAQVDVLIINLEGVDRGGVVVGYVLFLVILFWIGLGVLQDIKNIKKAHLDSELEGD